jgi:hypothetical protein
MVGDVCCPEEGLGMAAAMGFAFSEAFGEGVGGGVIFAVCPIKPKEKNIPHNISIAGIFLFIFIYLHLQNTIYKSILDQKMLMRC